MPDLGPFVDTNRGWKPIDTAPADRIVLIGTEYMKIVAYKDEYEQWRKGNANCFDRPVKYRPYQWKHVD